MREPRIVPALNGPALPPELKYRSVDAPEDLKERVAQSDESLPNSKSGLPDNTVQVFAGALNCRGTTLHDGFESYLTPPPEEYENVLRTGLVSLDTNVLLDFYRFAKVTRADLSRLLSKLDDRLFVSHQAVEEFWRNREGTLQAYERSLNEVQTKISSLKEQGEGAVRQWANVISLPDKEIKQAVGAWTKAVESLYMRLDQLGTRHKSATSFDTNKDEVLKELAALLDGRVGNAPDPEMAKHRRAEGVRRQNESIPPGYMDKGKTSGLAVGDYVLWAQVLDEAKERQLDVLLVTRDSKEDWWHKGGGHPVPRRELQSEFRSVTGRRLYMLRTPDFLRLGAEVFGLHVSESSITDAAQADRRARRSVGGGKAAIDRLARRPGESYASAIIRMTQLAGDDPDYEELVARYRQEFPNITIDGEARRRVDNLFSLGLVLLDEGAAVITSLGRELIRSRDVGLLQRSFLERIFGAEEILAAARGGDTQERIREHPPVDMSRTQLDHVVRWLSGLGLWTGTGVIESGEDDTLGLDVSLQNGE